MRILPLLMIARINGGAGGVTVGESLASFPPRAAGGLSPLRSRVKAEGGAGAGSGRICRHLSRCDRVADTHLYVASVALSTRGAALAASVMARRRLSRAGVTFAWWLTGVAALVGTPACDYARHAEHEKRERRDANCYPARRRRQLQPRCHWRAQPPDHFRASHTTLEMFASSILHDNHFLTSALLEDASDISSDLHGFASGRASTLRDSLWAAVGVLGLIILLPPLRCRQLARTPLVHGIAATLG
ncbi:MAG: hypothetical protein SGPRY_006814 [Prymnesium sp.]